MEFNFKIKNDRLTSGGYNSGFTGNVNTYICHFDIECSIQGLMWFCIFKQGENVYRQLIENGCCIIPQEVLKNPEPLYIGCYGTNADENIKRVSTNLICFDIKQGAYSESTMPDVPTPDVWEMLVSKCVPIIGENGNWFLYDIKQGNYVDSGVSAVDGGGGAKLTDEQLANIDKIPMIEAGVNGARTEIISMGSRMVSLDNKISQAGALADRAYTTAADKQDKTRIITHAAEETEFNFLFNENYNTEHRFLAEAMTSISFTFGNSVYDNSYMSGLSFNSGETPTTISYTNSGILNWVGTDCTNADGLSIFQPSANTHYDIVFYFNGTQMIGLVNGFVPASGNEVV